MSGRAHGQIRQSQAVTTWGPGALLDLPRYSVIVGGLETWPKSSELIEIIEPRLTRKLQDLTGVHAPRLFAPPTDSADPGEPKRGIAVWRFPGWFVVNETGGGEARERSRRLVPQKALERGKFERLDVIPTRFVRGCPRGHVDDLDWYAYVHGQGDPCRRQMWLDERGTSGDLADNVVRCECKRSRSMHEATDLSTNPLGTCRGTRPWLGDYSSEDCHLPSRLLIRTAANAYFPQVVSVLSLPEMVSPVVTAVRELWTTLQEVDAVEQVTMLKQVLAPVREKLAAFSDGDIIEAIRSVRSGGAEERPVKQAEIEALLAVPEGFGDDIPVNPDFHARKLPDAIWRRSIRTDGISAIVQLHRLREVRALSGFTRFEAEVPDIDGEFDTDVERAALALEPLWFPAVENRGEGVLLQLSASAVKAWLQREGVKQRLQRLNAGHLRWAAHRKVTRAFPGGPYVLLHTLSHLLVQSLSMRSGYPASSIRERVYADGLTERFGILLYTGSPDAEGTLGGLVQQGRHIEDNLAQMLQSSELCSNDPICAQHAPGQSIEGRWLHGAACHGCALIAETSCEMRNDYLDRALVVPVLGTKDAAFFGSVG